jgi:4-aminobutyrate aminotransferase-like enzyme
VEQAAQQGEYLRAELRKALDRHPAVGDIRGAGLFVGIEFVTDKEKRTPMEGGPMMGWLSDQLLQRGLIARCDDRLDPVIQLSPPLVITKEEIDRVVGILDEVIGALEEELHM